MAVAEVNVSLTAYKAEGTDDSFDRALWDLQPLGLTFPNRFVFEDQDAEIRGSQPMPNRRKMAKDAPRRDRRAAMTTFVSNTTEYIGRLLPVYPSLCHAEVLPSLRNSLPKTNLQERRLEQPVSLIA